MLDPQVLLDPLERVRPASASCKSGDCRRGEHKVVRHAPASCPSPPPPLLLPPPPSPPPSPPSPPPPSPLLSLSPPSPPPLPPPPPPSPPPSSSCCRRVTVLSSRSSCHLRARVGVSRASAPLRVRVDLQVAALLELQMPWAASMSRTFSVFARCALRRSTVCVFVRRIFPASALPSLLRLLRSLSDFTACFVPSPQFCYYLSHLLVLPPPPVET